MQHQRWAARTAVLGVLMAVLAAPATAGADSLVFNEPDGNVYLATPDGSGLYQVTLDGSPGDPYQAPSQADNGTIATARDKTIYRLKQNGAVLSAFEPPVVFSLGVLDPQISPDGTKIAYWTGFFGNATCDPGSSGTKACITTAVTAANGPQDLGVALPDYAKPSWVSNTRVVANNSTGGLIQLADVGGPDFQWFQSTSFSDISGFPHDPQVSRDGRRLVTTTGQSAENLVLWATAANPATGTSQPAPTPICGLTGPAGGHFNAPTWSPDGGHVAWEESDGDPNTPPGNGEGIWVWNTGSTGALTSCNGALPTEPTFPDASNPDWGPAPVNPGPREPGAPPPSPPPPPPPPPTPPPPADVVAPAFQGRLSLRPSTFADAPRGASIATAKVGTTVTYRLSEAAAVTFTVARQQPGRKVGKRCVKPTRSNRRKRSCKRFVAVNGSFVDHAKAGSNSFKFTGRLRNRKLSPGRYRLTATARDAAGNRSKTMHANFRIVRR